MAEARIPFFPRGRPVGPDFDELLTEVLVFAKLDLSRAIEPSITLDEQRQGLRPPDSVLLRRFTDRAARQITELAWRTDVVLVLPWKADEPLGFQEGLMEVARKVPKIQLDSDARHVVYLEGLGNDAEFARVNGRLDETWRTSLGTFFIVRWPATDSTRAIGRRLRAFLARQLAVDSSVPPSQATGAARRAGLKPTKRDSVAHFRAVSDILKPFSASEPPPAEDTVPPSKRKPKA